MMQDGRFNQPQSRLREFGKFLRSRRERLTHVQAGLPPGFRRRTPGLRREEVAQLAGIGATWYTWLEQGRDVRPSVEVLEAIAEALQLGQAERQYLFVLAGISLHEDRAAGAECVPDALMRMLIGMKDQPAYVLGRRCDILAWNDAAVRVFGDFGTLEGDQRNLIHLMFTSKTHRQLLVDWDDIAPVSLAMFRADSAYYAGDPDFERLISRLEKASPQFRVWWSSHDVVHQPSTVKRIRHPDDGLLVFEYMSLSVDGCPGMRFVVCTPEGKG
ncbi:helix-turn-helix transcriptional regulator [Sodalis ligni]|uniref:Helix-turn-helix protein n=1 Tax=Sodalis ligni TaxID=2697027 RepID=A0A4R1NNJ9_9GAMM|nr:helix-turn-helix transcriptional regulator [Sodalis ligni]TCL06296.1 helix-turn-helix protein [Sodalis ligni]